jgi:thymidine phosphorylase
MRNEAGAPEDLRQRAVTLAGRLLELGGKALPGQGVALAMEVLALQRGTWHKMQALCARGAAACASRAAPPRPVITAQHAGRVVAVDNRRLASWPSWLAAPRRRRGGRPVAACGDRLDGGSRAAAVHAARESPGELAYALSYAHAQEDLYTIEEHP